MAGPNQAFTLAHFTIERRLATGGMAEVFLARKEGAEGTKILANPTSVSSKLGSLRAFFVPSVFK